MNVAIIGSSGYIAGYLLCRLEEDPVVNMILRIGRTKEANIYLDLQHTEYFDDEVLKDVDFVIFTAAVSGPDQCAEDYGRCWSVNVTGTIDIIKRALQHRCKILFFSSDAVFGDIPGHIYDEQSSTAAETAYGRMKKVVEDSFFDNYLFKAIRLSYVVSVRDRFVSYCLKCLNQGEIAEIFHPFYRNCITVTEVVDTVQWLLHHWELFEPALLNVAGNEMISRVRIADELNRLVHGKFKYIIKQPDEVFYQNRPAITQMRSLYLKKFNILSDSNFTERFQKELKGLIR